jgi:hypothetical protein
MRPLLALALLLVAGHADAQTYIRAECQKLIAPAGLAPGSVTERWYRRFWTGDCGGLFGCVPGSPNWNEVVAQLSARAKPAERTVVLAKGCGLGPLIGLEWTKSKKVRHIDTNDLRGFNKTLERAANVVAGIDAVEAQARAKIAGR